MHGFVISDVPRQPHEEFSAKKLNSDIADIIRHAKLYLEVPLPTFREEAYRILGIVGAYCAGVCEPHKYAMLAKNTLDSLPKFEAAMLRVFESKDKPALEEMFDAFEIEFTEP